MSDYIDIISGLRNEKFIRNNRSVRRLVQSVFRRSGSQSTVETYVAGVKMFVEFLGYPSADSLINGNVDWSIAIEDFVDHLFSRGVTRSTITTYVAAVKKWLKVNKVDFRFDVELPQVWNVERDRVPSKDEIRRILQVADLQDKVIILLAVSSGLRRSTITSLRLKDVDLDDEIPVIRVKPEISKDRPSKGYVTFMTPECKKYLQAYLRERELSGEKLTPDSPLISGRPLGNPLPPMAITWRWERLLKKVGLDERTEPVEKRGHMMVGGKWYKIRFHSLRKYFKSWCVLSGVPSEIVEFFMGHRAGIEHVYFLTGIEDMNNPILVDKLREYYRKAIPNLTITEVDVEQLRRLEKELEEIKSKYTSQEEIIQTLEKKLNRLTRILKEIMLLDT